MMVRTQLHRSRHFRQRPIHTNNTEDDPRPAVVITSPGRVLLSIVTEQPLLRWTPHSQLAQRCELAGLTPFEMGMAVGQMLQLGIIEIDENSQETGAAPAPIPIRDYRSAPRQTPPQIPPQAPPRRYGMVD